MEETDIPYSPDRTAKFNSGIAKLMRMGRLREGCHDYRMSRNPSSWFNALKGFRSEINAKLTRETNKKGDKPESDIAKEFEDKIRSMLKKNDKYEEIEDILYMYELWLGDMEEKYKFGMPDDEFAGAALR